MSLSGAESASPQSWRNERFNGVELLARIHTRVDFRPEGGESADLDLSTRGRQRRWVGQRSDRAAARRVGSLRSGAS